MVNLDRQDANVDHHRSEQFLQALLPSVRAAGHAALKRWKRSDEVTIKPDGSPVTPADLEVNSLLCSACKKLDPSIPILSEENKGNLDLGAPLMFIVDPIDGTRDFIGGSKDFTINVAVIEEGIPRLGIIFAPAHKRLFFVDGQSRAFEEDSEGHRRRLGPISPREQAPRIVVSRSHLDARTISLVGKLNPTSVSPVGSSLKFALLVAGEADLYPRLSPMMAWDCAAGQALLNAVGGVVMKFDGRQPFYGAGGDRIIDAFVAASTAIAARGAIELMRLK